MGEEVEGLTYKLHRSRFIVISVKDIISPVLSIAAEEVAPVIIFVIDVISDPLFIVDVYRGDKG